MIRFLFLHIGLRLRRPIYYTIFLPSDNPDAPSRLGLAGDRVQALHHIRTSVQPYWSVLQPLPQGVGHLGQSGVTDLGALSVYFYLSSSNSPILLLPFLFTV